MNIVIEDEYLAILVDSHPNTTGKRKYPMEVEKKFVQRINQLASVTNENDLRELKSLHFERLKGKLDGKHSIRVNKAWRIVFRIEGDGSLKVLFIEELNNHYND